MALPVDDGRAGDIWRLYAVDRPVRVVKHDGYKFAFRPLAEPDGKTYGVGRFDWDMTLERFREDLGTLLPGDIATVYVAPTEIYILRIEADKWKAWKTGRPPGPQDMNLGLFFDPSEDWNLDGELLYRPFAMLRDGERVADCQGRGWTFTAPFWFTDEQGRRGTPLWPLSLVDDHKRTTRLNNTSVEREKSDWTARSGVKPDVFDLP